MNLKSNNFFLKNIFYFLYLSFFILGLIIFNDFGISVDEEFQRYSGFYWLNYVLEFTPFESLKFSVENKLSEIGGFTLPNPKDYPFYGVIFDLPLALIETILKVNEPRDYFLLRHFFTFSLFFISALYFHKILENRFKEKIIIFFGVLLYISSPRVFADSFYNNKDLVFLSFVTISLSYYFKLIDNFNYKNILNFSFFASLTCVARIIGIFLPVTFLLFIFLSNKKIDKDYSLVKKILFFIFCFLLFLYLFWPFLWEAPAANFIYAFNKSSQVGLSIQMLFNGNYIFSNLLPISYLPTWIIITTPILSLILFLVGYTIIIKRSFARLINIKPDTIYSDFWRGKKENKDFFVVLNFSLIFFYIILSNSVLYTGWRQLYFLHVFLIYVGCFAIYFLNLKIKKKIFLHSFIFTFILISFYNIYKFHPYQSSYFNILVSESKKKDFEIDYWGLAGVKFLNEVLSIEQNKELIKIGVASYIPLERSLKMLKKEIAKKIEIVGQDYKSANYIFNNNMSEVNKNKNNKYQIPVSFKKIKEFSIDGFVIYEIYKKID